MGFGLRNLNFILSKTSLLFWPGKLIRIKLFFWNPENRGIGFQRKSSPPSGPQGTSRHINTSHLLAHNFLSLADNQATHFLKAVLSIEYGICNLLCYPPFIRIYKNVLSRGLSTGLLALGLALSAFWVGRQKFPI